MIERPGRALSITVQVLLLAAPPLVALAFNDNFLNDSLSEVLLSACLALSWSLLGGYARQVSAGHVAFFGIGAYTSTLLDIHFSLSPWIGMLAGGAIGAIAGLALGLVTFRLRGTFFAMSTIAFAEVIRILAVNTSELTHGSQGLTIDSTPNPAMFVFGSIRDYVLVIWLLMMVIFGISWLLARSKTGLRLLAMREEENAARALGVNIFRLRLFVMGMSAFLTAVTGTFYAQYLLFIDPDSVLGVDVSLQMALVSVVGGIDWVIGPVLGTYLVVPFGQWLRAELGGQFAGLHLVIYGIGLILVLYKMPNGVWPVIEAWLRRTGDRALRPAPRALPVRKDGAA